MYIFNYIIVRQKNKDQYVIQFDLGAKEKFKGLAFGMLLLKSYFAHRTVVGRFNSPFFLIGQEKNCVLN